MGAKRQRQAQSTTDQPQPLSDSRFVAAETDPRFGRLPKRPKKPLVDNRFKQSLKQNPAFRKSDTPVDRFGRLKTKESLHKSLPHLAPEQDDSDSESDQDINEDKPVAISTLDDDSNSDDSDISEFFGEEEEQPEQIPCGKATNRLAVVGLDWSTTRAVDIYACLDSFCPPGKSVKCVEVHPSKFGLERLAAEAKFGPQVIAKDDMKVVEDARKKNLVDKRGKSNVPGNSGESQKEDEHDSEPESEEDISDSDNEGVEEKRWKEQAALRKYEEERLKYYYAVVEFEDVKAADAVYEQCDGVEYVQSGRACDLRFIPDDMVIETTPRDRAESVPDGYVPPNVNPSSLNSSTVKLSWDADDPDRVVLKKKAIGKEQLDEENLKAYLGSSSEEDDVKETAADIEKKKSLLLGSDENEAEEEPEMGMEISFEPGMLEKAEDIVKRKKSKDEREGETHWEARLRRQQERKAEKRKKRREQRDAFKANGGTVKPNYDEGADDDTKKNESAGFSDPFFSQERRIEDNEQVNKSKKRSASRRKASSEGETKPTNDTKDEARKRAELELLVMDKGTRNAKNTGSVRDMLAAAESDEDDDRAKSRRGKRGDRRRRDRQDKEAKNATVEPSTMDINDPRFQGLFDSHLFAMDPTHPKYRDNETTQRIRKEKMRRSKQGHGDHDVPKQGVQKEQRELSKGQENIEKAHTANSELRQLAARLKARSRIGGKKSWKR